MAKFKAGSTVTVLVTYEVTVDITKDCDADGLAELATHDLLESGAIHESMVKCALASSPEHDVGDEDDEDEEETYHISRETEAKALWDEFREGKNDANGAFPDLTPNQLQFVSDCLDQGLAVRTYSGRFMYGRYCPGVVVSHPSDVSTRVKYSTDSMGLDTIVYVSN